MRKLREQATKGNGRMATLAAEATIDLAVCRAVFERAANLIDQHYEAHPTSTGSDEALTDCSVRCRPRRHSSVTRHPA